MPLALGAGLGYASTVAGLPPEALAPDAQARDRHQQPRSGLADGGAIDPAAEAVIWDDQRIVVPGLETLRTWHDTGLTWPIGKSRVKLRTVAPRLVVLHCTDGERSARGVHQTLTNADNGRGYSIHFVLEEDGTIVQLLDPATRVAAHVGGLNDESVGIEIECAMTSKVQPVPTKPRPLDRHIYQIAVMKNGVKKWVRSRRGPCWGLYPEQLAALAVLVPALCVLMGVPEKLADERDYVPREERAALRGVIGHAQVTTGHADPPLAALNLFRAPA